MLVFLTKIQHYMNEAKRKKENLRESFCYKSILAWMAKILYWHTAPKLSQNSDILF